jgi:hypothetical protein
MWSTWQNPVSDSVLKTDRMSDTPKIWIGWANKHSPTRVLQIVPDYWFSALPKAKHQLFLLTTAGQCFYIMYRWVI